MIGQTLRLWLVVFTFFKYCYDNSYVTITPATCPAVAIAWGGGGGGEH